MKNICLSLLLTTFAAHSFLCAQTPSRVTVFSQNGEKFWVVVNGVRQNDQPATNVCVTGLTMPNALFKIIFEDESIPSLDKNTLLRDGDNKPIEINYVLRRNKKGEMVMNVSSFAPIEEQMAAAPPPRDMAVVSYRPNERQNNIIQLPDGTITTTTKTTTTTTTVGQTMPGMNVTIQDDLAGGQVGVNMNMGGIHHNMEIRESQTQTMAQASRPPQTTTATINTPGRCAVPVSQSSFETFKNSLRNTSFSDSQEKMARDYVRKNCLSAQQIKEMISLLNFNDTQLSVAKFAYDTCVDKENYFLVAEALKFSSSRDELMEYISTR